MHDASTVNHNVELAEAFQYSIQDVSPRALKRHIIGMSDTGTLWSSLGCSRDVFLVHVDSEDLGSFCYELRYDPATETCSSASDYDYL